jgi:folate-dependent phosphoribosylglycinamide formyltransferase PurN
MNHWRPRGRLGLERAPSRKITTTSTFACHTDTRRSARISIRMLRTVKGREQWVTLSGYFHALRAKVLEQFADDLPDLECSHRLSLETLAVLGLQPEH